ncbi:hypothetical protein GCM10010869_25460 [Mesorhizobium tianshanense]|nr:hypothetical protein GCM10010869_25460 [Mesorhizobium tianshanense]
MSVANHFRAVFRNAFIWDSHAGFAPHTDLDLQFLTRWKDAGVSHAAINVGFDVMSWDQTPSPYDCWA